MNWRLHSLTCDSRTLPDHYVIVKRFRVIINWLELFFRCSNCKENILKNRHTLNHCGRRYIWLLYSWPLSWKENGEENILAVSDPKEDFSVIISTLPFRFPDKMTNYYTKINCNQLFLFLNDKSFHLTPYFSFQ